MKVDRTKISYGNVKLMTDTCAWLLLPVFSLTNSFLTVRVEIREDIIFGQFTEVILSVMPQDNTYNRTSINQPGNRWINVISTENNVFVCWHLLG